MNGLDPSSAPRPPQNKQGMWICDECGGYNDPLENACTHCQWEPEKEDKDEE